MACSSINVTGLKNWRREAKKNVQLSCSIWMTETVYRHNVAGCLQTRLGLSKWQNQAQIWCDCVVLCHGLWNTLLYLLKPVRRFTLFLNTPSAWHSIDFTMSTDSLETPTFAERHQLWVQCLLLLLGKGGCMLESHLPYQAVCLREECISPF